MYKKDEEENLNALTKIDKVVLIKKGLENGISETI